MNNPANLNDLIEFIGGRYKFTVDGYPRMIGLTDDADVEAFAIKHSLLHMQKSLGTLATECERYDHGGKIDPSKVKEAVVKMLIDTLKLAEEMGMSGDSLGQNVPAFMASK